jgi:ABC transport system ATP-binding/permease protein
MIIELISAEVPQRTFVLSDLPAMVGRNPSSQVRLEAVDVGQFQCIIDQDAGELNIRDIWGGLGIFINGIRVTRASLMPGDRLTVGRTDFLVQYERSEEISREPTKGKAQNRDIVSVVG